MKKYYKYIYALILPALFTACLKDDDIIGPGSDGSVANIIEFGNPAAPASGIESTIPLYALAFDLTPTGELNLVIKCVGASKALSDIKVNVALDNSLLATYNTQNKTSYVELPADQYALTTTELTIKKGEREAVLPISLKPNLFTFDKEYAIGLKIASISSGVISQKFGQVVLNISGKNPYDGLFVLKTSAATSLVANATKNVKLVTVGPNRVKLDPGLLGTYSNEVFYTIDPVTFGVTVECPSLGVQTPQDTRSKWDPESKVLTVYWKQAGGGRTFEETFTYTGSR